MQIDGRVAVSGDEPHLFAERQGLRLRSDPELAVLVRDAGHFHVGALVHPRGTALGAVGLEPCVHDCPIGCRHAHHRREHKETVFEFRVASTVGGADTSIFRVHEHI